MTERPTNVALISGVLWGIIALSCASSVGTAGPALLARNATVFVLCGLVVGWLVGVGLRRLSTPATSTLIVLSGASLIGTTMLCAQLTMTTLSMWAALQYGRVEPNPIMSVLFVAPMYWVWWLFSSGYVWILWPLAALNHAWFFRVRDRAAPV